MNENQAKALRLIASGARLTDHGNAVVSREAGALLRNGLIGYAPHRWIAYELTAAGRAAIV